MIDLNKLDENNYVESLTISLKKRNAKNISIENLKLLVNNRKQVITELDTLRAERNQIMNQYKGQMPPSSMKARLSFLKEQVVDLEKKLEVAKDVLTEYSYHIPNILKEDVPYGISEDENQEIKKWGNIPTFNFHIKPHDEVAEKLDILDIQRGVKLAGSRFYTLKKEGALLERALANFFLDEAIKAGYEETFVPAMVNQNALFGTGQLPKFANDLFKIEGEELYLIPTAEVPLTNLFAREILKESGFPYSFTASTPCFRKEAGSYGKDTKGIFRVHQFQKVELVKYVLPHQAEEELESLVGHAMMLLEKLKLPYRQVLLCGGDTGFTSEKTYDLEVYLPYEKKYREISSCSSFGSFQARRAQLKYKSKEGHNELFSTLNGSALAVGRTWIAIIENYQNEDGSVSIPDVLKPYMNNLEKINVKK